jgi:hypothetical protein
MSFHQDWDAAKYQAGEPPKPDAQEASVIVSPNTLGGKRLSPG